MPELPEVETVASELRSQIINKKLKQISVFWDRTFEDYCSEILEGQSIKYIGRKGKYLILNLDHTQLVIHLRMTGQLLFYDQAPDQENKHLRFKFHFTDQSELHFVDTRKFGRIYHIQNTEEFLGHVGMDALDSRMNKERFKILLNSSKMNIKAFLLNQKSISGLGNIYVDEALFRTGLHPSTKVASLSDSKKEELFDHVSHILIDAIKNMGSTISDYRDSYGNEGNNQRFLKVYGRGGEPCVTCGTAITKIRFAGRGTYYCPQCQINRRD